MITLPWQKHKQETAELHAKLEVESQRVDEARARTAEAAVGQVNSRTTSNILLHQVRLNGWTELLQQAWKGKA